MSKVDFVAITWTVSPEPNSCRKSVLVVLCFSCEADIYWLHSIFMFWVLAGIGYRLFKWVHTQYKPQEAIVIVTNQ